MASFKPPSSLKQSIGVMLTELYFLKHLSIHALVQSAILRHLDHLTLSLHLVWKIEKGTKEPMAMTPKQGVGPTDFFHNANFSSSYFWTCRKWSLGVSLLFCLGGEHVSIYE